jgi:ribosome-binding protein aMBF1 (putative translation factor)
MQAEKTTERKAYKQKDKGIYERVGKALQRQRERLGLKAAQVANDRISATIVAKMEKGEALTLDNLSTIARQLKTNLASIFAEAEQLREPEPSVEEAEADVPTDAEPDACAECEGEGCPACDDDGDQFGR